MAARPWVFGATVVGMVLAWAYSAPPRLKRNGWWGNTAVAACYEGLPWFTGAAVIAGTLPDWRILALAGLYSVGAHGIMTLNDFKSIEGDKRMGILSLPVHLGADRAARFACFVMALPQVAVIALLVDWGQPVHAAVVALSLALQGAAMARMLKRPKDLAPWYNATGVSFYVLGMLVSALRSGALLASDETTKSLGEGSNEHGVDLYRRRNHRVELDWHRPPWARANRPRRDRGADDIDTKPGHGRRAGLPAMLPGALVAIHYAVQMLRPRWGHGSDMGGRRTPWILGGMATLALGGVAAAGSVALMETHLVAGTVAAVAAFLVIGVGVGASGTSLLVLLATEVSERRPAAASIVWLMMIAGFVVTTITAGSFLDPYSPSRLVAVSGSVSAIASW